MKKRAAQTQQRINKATNLRKFLERTSEGAETIQKAITPAYIIDKVQSEIDKADKLTDPDSEETRTLSTNLQKLEDVVGPELAKAYEEQIAARNDFLLEKAGPAPETTPFGTAKRELDEETQETLARYISAVDDPVGAIERLSLGEHSSEDLETLETLYPSMLSEWRQKAMDQLAGMKTPPTYDQQQAIASLLGFPDESLQFWQQFASTSNKVQEEIGSEPPRGNGRLRLDADTMKSKGDRLG